MKITIEHLKNYLGTGLLCILDYGDESYNDELIGLYANGDLVFSQDEGDVHTSEEIKPICYRLSDLDKFIPELGFVPLDELYFVAGHSRDVSTQKSRLMHVWKKSMMSQIAMLKHYELDFWILSKMFEWNFWPFDQSAFDEGLVIDKLQYGKEVTNG